MKLSLVLSGVLVAGIAGSVSAQEPSDTTRADQDRCDCVRHRVAPGWIGRFSAPLELPDGGWLMRVHPRIRIRQAPDLRLRRELELGARAERLRERVRVAPRLRSIPELSPRLRFRFRGPAGRYRTI